MDKPHEFETTTAMLARRAPGFAWLPSVLRKRLSPAALWGAIAALAAAIGYVANAQHDINRHQESIAELQAGREQDRVSREHDRELLQKIDTQLAVVNSKIGDIATEQDRQREWRERIEDVAEQPPHPRRRH